MNFNELKTVLRTQKRNKLIMLINLLGLTVGIASVAIIAAFVVSELNRGKEIPNSQNIYRIESETELGHLGLTPYPLGNYLKNKFDDIINFVNIQPSNFGGGTYGLNIIEVANRNFDIKNLSYADSSFFKIFKYKSIYGNLNQALDNPNGLVLTKSESLRIFGDTDPIGKTVKLNDNRLLEVEAVIEDIPNDAMNYFQSVASLQGKFQAENILHEERWGQFDFFCYFQLPSNTDLVKLEKETSTVLNERFAKKIGMDFTNKVSFVPYSDLYFHEPSILEHLKHGSFQTVMVFISVSILILLVAVINFINLSKAQGLQRAKEIGIRQINGSSRKKILLVFVAESILITFASFLLSIVLVKVTSLFTTNNDLSSIFSILYSPIFITFLFVGIIFTGVIAGIFSGSHILRLNPIQTLKGQKSLSIQQSKYKSGITSVQFVIAIALIVAIITVNKQIRFIEVKDLGFQKENLVYFQLKNDKNKNEVLYNKLVEHASIQYFSATDGLPGMQLSRTGAYLSFKGETKIVKYMTINSDYHYLSTMGMKMARGRNFREGDKDVIIINESFAKAFGIDTFDDQINLDNRSVIGIVKDFQIESLHRQTEPLAIRLAPYTAYGVVRISSDDPVIVSDALSYIKSSYKETFDDRPIDIHFLNESLEMMYQKERTFSHVLSTFVLLALFVSCIGLFGISLYIIKTRIKEIGIRKVNGAKISEVLVMLNKDFIKWVAIAFVIATPIAYYAMNKWLENFAYKTELSWWIFALSGLLALEIALLTVSFQSWKAATKNPVESLRYE